MLSKSHIFGLPGEFCDVLKVNKTVLMKTHSGFHQENLADGIVYVRFCDLTALHRINDRVEGTVEVRGNHDYVTSGLYSIHSGKRCGAALFRIVKSGYALHLQSIGEHDALESQLVFQNSCYDLRRYSGNSVWIGIDCGDAGMREHD